MFSKYWLPNVVLVISVLVPSEIKCGEIPVVDSGRIKQFKQDMQKIIGDIRWAIGIYDDVKGSYQQLARISH